MRILGDDPGYERLGLAVVENDPPEKIIFSDCVRTKAGDPIAKRLGEIGSAVAACINLYKPSELAIESLLFNTNQKTALLVAAARGVVMYEAGRFGLEVTEYSPLAVKAALTGYGRADKTQLSKMIERILKLPRKKRLDDEYDAIAIALTHSAIFRTKSLSTPKGGLQKKT